jgi:hypothetical protein
MTLRPLTVSRAYRGVTMQQGRTALSDGGAKPASGPLRYTGVIMQQGRVTLDSDGGGPSGAGGWARTVAAAFGNGIVISPSNRVSEYATVRRLSLQIEQALTNSLRWAVFQNNGPALWARLVSSVEGYLQSMFMQGAFQGTTPSRAYFVRCDAGTTNPTDIQNGVVNIVVGFAPVYPAEFVILVLGVAAGPGPSHKP